MNKIRIESEDIKITLDVDFIDNPTADKIQEYLPIVSTVSTWGNEIYFDTGIKLPVQDATLDVNVGDVAYWPEGKCLCIFFGATPASTNAKPVPASEVVIVARSNVTPEALRLVAPGARIIVE